MQAHRVLESWRTGFPIQLHNIHRYETGFRRPEDAPFDLDHGSQVSCGHICHFLSLDGSQSKGLISKHYRKRSMELCVKSAQAVLAIAARIASCDILGG
jgi:hypothetical protein